MIDVGLVLLFLFLPHDIYGDAVVRFDALRDLIEHHTISHMAYSIVQPLAAAPAYLLGKLWFTPAWWCARSNTLLLAAGLIVGRRLLRTDDERETWQRFALLLVAASMFPNHLRNFAGEVFTAVLIAVGLLAVRADYRLSGWAAVVAGVVNTPAAVAGLAIVVFVEAWETRRLAHLAALPAAVALILLESWIRRGSPWVSGYENNAGFRTVMPYSGQPGFSYPMFFGLLSILFSFGKGLVFFAPGLLLWMRRGASSGRRLSASYRLWMWFLVGLILVYSKWWAWYGGLAWGPRFFLFASIPAALALAARLREVRGSSLPALAALLIALTLSSWVGIAGAAYDQQGLDLCMQNDYALEFACWYVPEFSVLWRPFTAGLPLTEPAGVLAAYGVVAYVFLAWPVVAEIVAAARRQLRRRT